MNSGQTAIVKADDQTGANDIRSMILTIRGKQVLLDSDVALLYGYETRRINETARRNKKRFPEEFRFKLTKEEAMEVSRCQTGTLNNEQRDGMRCQTGTASTSESSRSQSVTLNVGRGSNIKYQPYAYTEQGIAMLSGLLRNDIAVQVSINIMNAFVEMRKYIYANKNVFDNIVSINTKLLEHDSELLKQGAQINEIFNLLNAPEANKQWIFYKGQFYDAFEWVTKVIRKAKSSITIIDSYADKSIFKLLKDKRDTVNDVTIITARPGMIDDKTQEKWTAQYGEPKIIKCNAFHDRFIILDDKYVYAIGASLKDLGKKCFAVSKNEDTEQFMKYVHSHTASN
jgi:hypothetical protein